MANIYRGGVIIGNPILQVVPSGLQLYINPSIVQSSGATVYDYLGNNVGTINNSTGVLVNDPTVGKIFQFNGTDQYITINNTLAFSAGFTMQFIIKKGVNLPGFSWIFSSVSPTNFSLYEIVNNQRRFYIETSNGGGFLNPDLSSNINSWVMLTLINSNANNNQTKLLQNKSTTSYICTSNNSILSGNLNVFLGRYPGQSNYSGNFGAYMFYNRVLNQNEINHNFDVAASRFGI